jgi:hypothetical protein
MIRISVAILKFESFDQVDRLAKILKLTLHEMSLRSINAAGNAFQPQGISELNQFSVGLGVGGVGLARSVGGLGDRAGHPQR